MATARNHVNFLYIVVHETSHYVLVRDMSRLISIQYNNHNCKHYFCQYCLHGCTSEKLLKNNLGRCKLHWAQRIKLAEADNKRGVTKLSCQKQNTNDVYLLPLSLNVLGKQDSCELSSSKFSTTQYQHQKVHDHNQLTGKYRGSQLKTHPTLITPWIQIK